MDKPNPTFAKIPILDTGKFEQWKFKIQQYLQNEHYALWEVIDLVTPTKLLQRKQAKTFGGNEATKKTKKNQLKQQYGNFKAEGSETLEQTFNRLQAILLTNQKWNVSIATKWAILVENAEHLEVKTESYMDNEEENHALVADDEVPTEFALMAKSSSSLKNEVEARLVEFKEHEIKFCEKIRGLERDVKIRDNKIEYLKNELEQVKKEKESLDNKLTVYSPPKKDLSWTCLPEFVDDTVTDYSRLTPSIDATKCNKMNSKVVNFLFLSMESHQGNPQNNIDDKGYWDSGCSRHMTGNISYLLSMSPMTEDMSHLDIEVERLLASVDESMLWHKRLGHLNFKTMNKLVRNNLVKGLPSKCFENDHTYVACLKRKQHKASCKTKLVNSVSKPLHILRMDLFGPTSVSSLNHKWYCLVVTDDFSRFTWTLFLRTKDATSRILRNFITEIENLKDLKVKIIKCDNRGEFKNKEMNEFCTKKGIRREFSNARTPQQNRAAKRRNKTLIEAARTMLADAKLPVTFWAEVANTA
nr:putative ribonuclease H-like domain-containing protein [Tanacetum cinerariifolium]